MSSLILCPVKSLFANVKGHFATSTPLLQHSQETYALHDIPKYGLFLSCVQTKSNERHKITYKVNVKMRLAAISLWATQISQNANHTVWHPSLSSPHRSKLKIFFSGDIAWHVHVTWRPDGKHVARFCQTDTESDMAVETAIAVNPVELLQHDFILHRIMLWTQTWRLWDFHNWYCAKMMIISAIINDETWKAHLPPDATS